MLIAYLKLLLIPLNQLFAVSCRWKIIGKEKYNGQYGIVIDVGNIFKRSKTSKHSIMTVGSVYVSIKPF